MQALISSKAGRAAKVLRLFRALQLMRIYADFEAREGAREGGRGPSRARPIANNSIGGGHSQGGGTLEKGTVAKASSGGRFGSSEDAGEAALRRYRFTETRVGQKLSGEAMNAFSLYTFQMLGSMRA